MKSVVLFLALFSSVSAFAQVEQELDSFGGNEALYLKAQALNPEVQNEVVQNRFINRTNRVEASLEGSSVFGGDAYNRTNNIGFNAHYHINPHWSIGAKYNYGINKLTPEGTAMVREAAQEAERNPENPSILFPQVIYPKSELLGLINWYPIVGKLSFGSWGVAHFDTYFTAGYGTMELGSNSPMASSNAGVATLGAGLGFWLGSNLTTRVEYRAEQYSAQYYDRTEDMLTGVASLQVGWIL
ncbi:outer membrane beta-barrel domain-containing protein [Bdellovibrio bacteriovorus]|uniref:Outer membrane beta-barrel domain-containing protein n=1 Tax=Bdellovibrio bacteriovorus TaxID=959 RepID=A0A150WF09_BDEBC|nr:outer membrane beta-barrel domain-containing protein [Bdellovibrio bacteriovorus]KYG61609.1 outer membrane beta-barrel domain-containing protein [Bdellovibrio bacteriovorus]